jgi:hypothetical protein
MPTFVSTSSARATDFKPVLLDCSANTRPLLAAESFASYYLATIDLIALAVAATSSRVVFQEEQELVDFSDPSVTAGSMRASARISLTDQVWKASPPHVVLSVVRERGLRVQHLRYENPFVAKVVADVAAGAGKTLVSFLEFFNLAGATRRLAEARADMEEIKAAVDDSTIELMIDEKFLLLNRLEIDNESREIDRDIKRTEHERARLEVVRLQVQIAQEVIEAQKQQVLAGTKQRVWTLDEAMSMVDNVRLLGSIRTTEQIGLQIRLSDEE